MTFGVLCNTKGKISFGECERCSKCLPRPLIRAIRPVTEKHVLNSYGVKQICGCLRKAYFLKTEDKRDQYFSLSQYLASKRGKYFEEILEASGWNELPVELEIQVDEETIYLRGTIDCYDGSSGSLVELKTLEIGTISLPREADVLQIKSYYSIGKAAKVLGEVKILKIVYLDMNRFKTVEIQSEDISDWLISRTIELHRAIKKREPPRKELSSKCRTCGLHKTCASSWVGKLESTPEEVEAIEVSTRL